MSVGRSLVLPIFLISLAVLLQATCRLEWYHTRNILWLLGSKELGNMNFVSILPNKYVDDQINQHTMLDRVRAKNQF